MPLIQLMAVLIGESLETDGRIDQVDFEWGRGHRPSCVAAEYSRTLPCTVRHPCGKVSWLGAFGAPEAP
jgi:hypothetical protein